MSQVNFFMLGPDEQAFLTMLAERRDTLLVEGRMYETAIPRQLREKPAFGKGDSRIVLVPSVLRPDATCTGGAGEPGGFYAFDLYRDPHCDFDRCTIDSGQLLSGRIFAKIGWLHDRAENETYRRWYAAIERWIKRKYHRHRTYWIGPAAYEWSLAGGLLRFGPPGTKSLVESLG